MLFLSIVIFILFSWLVYKMFSDQFSLSDFVILFFLCVITINIVISELLNFFDSLNNAFLYLAAQFSICALLSWVLIKKLIRSGKDVFSLPEIRFRQSFRTIDYFLFGIISLILIVLFLIGITTPPNNLDSLHTHLPRIFYWLQHGNLNHYIATTTKQNTYPIIAHLQGLWLFLFIRNASLFFVVQWFSLLVAVIVSYKLAKLLRLTTTQSLFSALIFLSLPVVLLQSFTFQGDLIVSTLLITSFLFTFDYIRTRDFKLLVVALLAVALALGTKQTAFFVLPAYILLFIYMLRANIIEVKRIAYLVSLFSIFLILSSYMYIQNTIKTGFPFESAEFSEPNGLTARGLGEKIEYNSLRLFYQFVSFDGIIGNFGAYLNQEKSNLFSHFTERRGIYLESEKYLRPGVSEAERFSYRTVPPLSEDNAWFGPLSYTLLPLALVWNLWRKDKLIRAYLSFSILMGIFYLLIIVIQRPGWDPYQGRYFIIPIITLCPFIGAIIPSKKLVESLAGIIIIIFTVSISISVILFNTMKPIITAATAWRLQDNIYEMMETNNKIFRVIGNYLTIKINAIAPNLMSRKSVYASDYYEQLLYNDNSLIPDIKFIDSIVPIDASVFIKLKQSPLEFALFGRYRTRNLYPYYDLPQIQPGFYLIVENDLISDELDILSLLGSNDHISIFK